ncbi:hypothetical protein AZA_87609 [Nitrospirillum viridazoti Y2]|nr:hypothetical protein AZA_87609 [Nitrospirillum amazonense Y2]
MEAQRFRAGRVAVGVWEEGEDVAVGGRHVQVDAPLFLKGVQHMGLEAIGAGEPADVAAVTIPAHHAELVGQMRLPFEMAAPRLDSVTVGRGRQHGKEDMVGRDGEIVDHTGIGCLHPDLTHQPTVGGEFVIDDVGGGGAPRLIAEGQQVACFRVYLGVGGEGRVADLAVEIPLPLRFQRLRIQRIGQAVLLQGQQHAVEGDDVGVGGAGAEADDAGIVRMGVAV